MKTVAKKVVKKAPTKVIAKSVTKVLTKKTVKPSKPAPKAVTKVVTKPVTKAVAKVGLKAVVKKPVPKAAVQKVVKRVVKTQVPLQAKASAKVVVKNTIAGKPIKPAGKSARKVATKPIPKSAAKPAAKSTKPLAEPSKKVTKKTEIPVEAIDNTKAASKSFQAESNLKQSMVLESKTVSPAIPPIPAQSKARTSRLASLTVPSMAQSVASTAAKSSYGPHVPSLAIIPPPQFSPKANPKLANNWKIKSAEEMSDEELLAMPDSEYMNIKQMTYFRLKLMQLKSGILVNAGATSEHLRDESAVVPDPTDRATIEEEHALELRTRDRERKLLKKIEQSIARIDVGDYGYCDETGEAIGVGRLLARPTATLSLEAQQRRELKQKMFGD
jgi:DnaK suppressor protein